MKLNHYFILLSSLFFFVSNSHADININKCKANEGEYVIFDEYDSQIAEKIIEQILHNQP